VEKEIPVRGPDGLCIECEPDEVGEAIGGISNRAGRNFEGYNKASDTEKKILHDVFKKGDAWFRTGDLMRRDAHGYFYFVDRIGDTFRWKGENVATLEVAAALSCAPHVKGAVVYGVAVPGMEGRAGMAALEVAEGFDLAAFRAHAAAVLPAYARPVFLRRAASLAVTGTFKYLKVNLARDGFNPAAVADPLFADLGQGYVALDEMLYARISAGRIRL
jgi:fatty-acyl-CoA synthase